MGPVLVPRRITSFNRTMDSTLQPLIVAIDDEADDIFVLRHLLQKSAVAHRFQPFGNGEAAVAGLTSLIEENNRASLPFVVFLDIKMAAMNGLDVLRWIRSQRALDTLPVIMLSSSDDPRDVDTARELSAQGYVKKYPSVAALQTVLQEARDFADIATPRKAFLEWNYRFVGSSEAIAAK
jgi:CheY-like chemotaxis protein